jgi:hypothetical protein
MYISGLLYRLVMNDKVGSKGNISKVDRRILSMHIDKHHTLSY